MRDIRDYYAHVVNLMATSGLTNEWHKVKLRSTGKREGTVYTIEDILLTDAATINFIEIVVIDGQTIRHAEYSYQ
jgi:hypothetical protein